MPILSNSTGLNLPISTYKYKDLFDADLRFNISALYFLVFMPKNSDKNKKWQATSIAFDSCLMFESLIEI